MIECDDPNCEQRFDDSQWYADEDDLLAAAKDEGWQILYKDEHPEVTFSPACRGGGFLLKNPSGFSIDRLSPHALWFARFMSRATR